MYSSAHTHFAFIEMHATIQGTAFVPRIKFGILRSAQTFVYIIKKFNFPGDLPEMSSRTKLLTPRQRELLLQNSSRKQHGAISEVFLAEISLRSPRKLIISVI